MSPSADRPFDAGLQLERTALAWRRTTLSLVVGSLAGARILPEVWGPAGLIVAGVGILASVALFVLAHRRFRLQSGRLRSAEPLADGTLPALMAAAVLAVAVVALVFTLAR